MMTEWFERIRREYKRALAIVLFIILLFSALPAGAEPATGNTEALRSFLQVHYGVTILMGDECSPFSPEGFNFLITPEGYTPFQQIVAGNDRFEHLLRIMDDVFSVYPPEFFSHFKDQNTPEGLRFLLVDQIFGEGARVGGLQTYQNGHIDIALAKDDAREREINHEIWHAMETRILFNNPHAFDEWPNLNPEDFLYTGDISIVGSGKENKEPDDWFAREYGRIDEYEDRATVFEALMKKDELWWGSRPYLQKKAQFLLDKAETVFGEIFPGD